MRRPALIAGSCLLTLVSVGCVATSGPTSGSASAWGAGESAAVAGTGPSGAVRPSQPRAPQEPVDEEAPESEILERRRAGSLGGAEPQELIWPGTRLYWDQGPRLDTLDGDLNLVFGARLQMDGAVFREDSEITATFGEPDPGVEVRRAFLELGALYRDRYEFRVMVDVTDPVDFRDLFVGMFDVPVVGSVRAGYYKEPFGLEEIESSNDITFMERSLTDAFVERRNLGVGVHRVFTSHLRATASLGLFREATNELEISNGHALTGRVTGLPLYEEDGRKLVHVGAGVSLRSPSDDTVQFSSKPESDRAQVLVDTGPFSATRELRFALEGATVLDSLSLQSEFILATADGADGYGSRVFPSYYLMGSYILTGEHRRYRRNVGAFGRVIPEDAAGAWELTARYSFIDLDSQDVQGGTLQDVTFGVNWYANFYSRVMFNFITARPDGFGVQHIAQIRLQVNI